MIVGLGFLAKICIYYNLLTKFNYNLNFAKMSDISFDLSADYIITINFEKTSLSSFFSKHKNKNHLLKKVYKHF